MDVSLFLLCVFIVFTSTATVSGDECIVNSEDRKHSEVETSPGADAVLPCNSRFHDQYVIAESIYWQFYNVTEYETILDNGYYSDYPEESDTGYSESEYSYNTTDNSLTVHNVKWNAGCYRCHQAFTQKHIHDANVVSTVPDSGISCRATGYNRYLTQRAVSEGERVVLRCPLYTYKEYEQYVWYHDIYWYDDTGTSSTSIVHHRLGSTQVYWYKAYRNDEFTYNLTDDSLTIPNMTNWYNACYRCWQVIGFYNIYDKVTLTVRVSVTSLTMLGAPAVGELIVKGSTIIVECVTNEANPTPQVTWTREGSSLDNVTDSIENLEVAQKMTSTLTIEVTRNHNNMRYSCISGSMSRTFTLSVIFPATSLTMSGAPGVGDWTEEGTTVSVKCVTDEGNPTPQVTWTREGSNPDSSTDSVDNLQEAGRYSSQKMTSTLTIKVTRNHNNMQYSCITGSMSRTFTLSVRFAATSLTMSGEPEVGEWVEEGTTVVVECVTDEGNPTPQVTWTRDEANIDPLTEMVQNFEVAGSYNSNIRRSVLTMQAHKSHHNNRFTCTSGATLSQFFTLAVRYGDHIITLSSSPESTNPVEENSIINFTCTIDVNPPPYLTLWTRGKVEKILEQRETSSLMVSMNITRKYNRLGIFCEAVSGGLENATTSNELNFDVMFEVTQLNLTSSQIGLIDEGQELNLTSLTDESNPTPDITWTRNGESIQTTHNLVVIYNGHFNAKYMKSTLSVTAYRGLDNSQYMCRVRSLNRVYQLQVTWPTEPAHSVMIAERTSHTAKVSWISGHSGGSPQIFILQFKTVDEITYNSSPFIEDTGFGSTLNYNINNLQANTVYSIQVTSFNSYKIQQHKVESNTVTFRTLPEVSSSSNVALIAGTVSAGVVVLLVMSVVGTLLLCKCRNRSKRAHTANPVTANGSNAPFSGNHGNSVEPAQYEEINLPLQVPPYTGAAAPQLKTTNVTQGEDSTQPESELYERVTPYELPAPPSLYKTLQTPPLYANVGDTPDYVNA